MDGRAGWIAVVAALVLTAGMVGWLLGGGGGDASGDASGDATEAAAGASASESTADPMPARTDEPATTRTPTPDATEEPTDGSTPTGTAALTPEPTSSPTPTPDPTSRPSPEPTAPPAALVIDFPVDGEIVGSSRINVIGTAPPGSSVTRDVPFWFDDHTTAGDDGLWMMPVELAEGENRLTFRIADDTDTAQVIVVTYRPNP